MEKYYRLLKKKFGTHRNVAEALMVSIRTYQYWRNGKKKPNPAWMERIIRMAEK